MEIETGQLWLDEEKFIDNIFKITNITGDTIDGGYISDRKWYENTKEKIIEKKSFKKDDFLKRFELLS